MTSDVRSRRPRVFVLAYHISPHDGRYLKLRTSFADAGFDVAATVPALPGRTWHESVDAVHVDLTPLPGKLGDWLTARRYTEGLVARGVQFAPDVIYAFDPEALPAALAIKKRTGARLIYDAHEFHEDEDPSAPARGQWVRRTELSAAEAIDAFITVNASIAALYRAERPGLPEALTVHNAVNPPASVADDGRLRASANVTTPHILLYQGGFAPLRGLDRLMEAASRLDERWTLVLMGAGNLEATLRGRADPARVRFLAPAPHEELASWTGGADLGALLYEDAGRNQHYCSPNKLWEYSAAGVPILGSDLPEIARVVRGAALGWLVSPDASAAEIATQINTKSESELVRARENALAFARRETWSTEVAPLQDAIERLARSSAR